MTASTLSPRQPTLSDARTMTAARIHRFGAPNVITVERIDMPEPKEEEVLIRVHAAGVGNWDALVRTGTSGLPQSLPLTLGAEVSGVVERVGTNVTDFHQGVFGVTN